ncbi:nicotinate-nucleotide adenylyltransferase [Enterococcus eurekensis]|jgi:nicotinate-nucleotide adenylyltransferase|uniref:Probable nicotinate-nucleotide adenylyltransferase n=2 Tax=Enterococcus TaxID=1350 RepID=A0ABV9M5Z2_9ENTE|nr:nicotinate-nucleotide adenylyltransferase [Candidatus Enterococcus avicola]
MGIETIQSVHTLPVTKVQFSTEGRKQVGILGGNFNPVHVTHLIVADQVGRSLGLDRVDLMPSFIPPHVDPKETIDANHRLAMLELAVAGNSMLGIETIELTRGGTSYTYETMLALKEANPDTDYYFIIGGDMVDYLPKWHRIDELMTLVQFVGVKRPNYPQETSYSVIWVDVPLMELSSTIVRSKTAQGCSIRYLVPETVRQYIIEKGLYQDDRTTNEI